MQTGLGEETNREFAETNERFRKACGREIRRCPKCNTPNELEHQRCKACGTSVTNQPVVWSVTAPTPRQASKFRRKKGAAYKNRNQ